MNLNFNIELANGYSNGTQIARVLSENWVKINSFCPKCGYKSLNDYKNNNPAADFFCQNCNSNLNLKVLNHL